MKILHLSCSARGDASASYQLSQRVLDRLLRRHPDAGVMARDLWRDPLPHVDGDYASALGGMANSADMARGSLGRSDQLIAELDSADCLLIATPMHNFTVPSVLKAWLDHVVRIGRTFNATAEGKVGTLADRPVYIAVSSGGWRSGERARQPDFLEPYLRAILATVGLHDLRFFSLQPTAAGPDVLAAAHVALEQELDAVFGAAPGSALTSAA